MMGRTELCKWLRENSSGDYRPAAEAADEIEFLAEGSDSFFRQAMQNGKAARSLREELARVQEQRDELRRALEIIAVGDAANPQTQAAEELIALGYWRDIPEARKPVDAPGIGAA